MSPAKAESASLWQPLRLPTFRNLLLANVVSDMGAFTQTVGAAWLMISLKAGPMYVALTQTAAALPLFILALPAGAIGDILDRRKVILYAQIWMAAAAVVLAAFTLTGRMSPVLLLVLTFAMAVGDAFESPSWRAVLPELVSKEDLPAASALNGIEFNFARAVGPALGGVVVAVAGAGAAFLFNALSFFGVIVTILRWKRTTVKPVAPPETVGGATLAAIRYVRFSPSVYKVLIRGGAAMFFASSLLALLPSITNRANGSAIGYGALLGVFGAGAVLGAIGMQRARSVWPTDTIVTAGIAVFGLASVAAGALHSILALGAAVFVCGAAWISFLSLFNVRVLNQAPDWVRARVLAITMLVFQGAVAAGSAAWGAVAAREGLQAALVWAGIGMLLSALLGVVLRLPDVTVDLTPWNHWRLPVLSSDTEITGPVLIVVEYQVGPARVPEFSRAIRRYGRIRRRDGASRWDIWQDAQTSGRFLETFVVSSWSEHARQHARAIRADEELEKQLRACLESEPLTRHLLYL